MAADLVQTPPIVTLTTDFGLVDEYVGVMKGLILARAPQARLVDLTHQVEPQNVGRAAFVLQGAVPYFPAGAIHLAVVDPGVGSARRIVLLESGGHLLLAPDNGLLTPFLPPVEEGGGEEAGALPVAAATLTTCQAWQVSNTALFRPAPSATFHGRDIFAPVAGALAAGLPPAEVGPPLDPAELVRLPWLQATIDQATADQPAAAINGVVIGVDRFGNLITNISRALVAQLGGPDQPWQITIQGRQLSGIHRSYHDLPPNQPAVLFGSRDTLEIAENCGNAARTLAAGPGAPLTVRAASIPGR